MTERHIIFALILTLAFTVGAIETKSQNSTNSPYTRFGYGLLKDPVFSVGQGMGGVSYGMRNNNMINPANPASFSSSDSTTFLFEFGASGLLSTFSSSNAQKTTFTGNLDYIAMQFPVTKWMGISAGVLPYSVVGYNYNFSDSIAIPSANGDANYSKYNQSFYGKGGISQVYLGASFDIANHVALGVSGYYMFGNIEHMRYLTYSSSEINTTNTLKTSELNVSSFNMRFGLQYHETVGDKHAFTIGGIYEYKSSLNGKLTEETVGVDSTTTSSANLFELPATYGGGFTYTYDDRITVGADFTFQEFAKVKYNGVSDTLSNRMKIAIGGEYVHNPRGIKYIDRMRWRFGLNYSSSYVKVGQNTSNDFSITAGIGLPLRNTKSVINVNLEYGNVGNGVNTLLKEQYLLIGFNVTLNETWFVKSKVR